jgi:hypothetical protein
MQRAIQGETPSAQGISIPRKRVRLAAKPVLSVKGVAEIARLWMGKTGKMPVLRAPRLNKPA